MAISAQDIKQLREITSAGMMDCKKALEETNGNIDEAIKWLREKGIAKAAKKNDRIAAEGLVAAIKEQNKAVIYEVNSETDFVAQNSQFLNLLGEIGDILINSNASSLDEALLLENNQSESLSTIINNAVATIGEKITLRRFTILTAKENQTIGLYVHANKRIATALLFSNKISDELAKQIAMHVAAMKPKFISRAEVSPEFLQNESEILLAEAKNDQKNVNKPDNIITKMVEGRLTKQLAEISLLEQPFVMNPDQKIGDLLKPSNSTILQMVRYEVGEGIEKDKIDFASEVMSQVRK